MIRQGKAQTKQSSFKRSVWTFLSLLVVVQLWSSEQHHDSGHDNGRCYGQHGSLDVVSSSRSHVRVSGGCHAWLCEGLLALVLFGCKENASLLVAGPVPVR